jgi:hypothetical protein
VGRNTGNKLKRAFTKKGGAKLETVETETGLLLLACGQSQKSTKRPRLKWNCCKKAIGEKIGDKR